MEPTFINEMIHKVRVANDLLNAEQKDEADLVLYELEVLLDELPAAVEDWAHLLVEEGKVCSEIRHLLHRDKYAAMNRLVDVFRRLCEVNRTACGTEVAPEFVEEL